MSLIKLNFKLILVNFIVLYYFAILDLKDFNEKESIAKTLRKPEQQLAEFNKSGKVQLRKFLPNIKGVETKLNGRINNDTVILKAVNN